MITAIDHINIVVADLERSIKFYTELLGFKLIRTAHLQGDWIEQVVGLKNVSADVAYVIAPAGEPRIELLHYKSPPGQHVPENSIANTRGLRHLAFRVKDIHPLVQRLKQAGVRLFGEPVTVPAGVVRHDAGDKTLIYFTDPDGVILELAEYSLNKDTE